MSQETVEVEIAGMKLELTGDYEEAEPPVYYPNDAAHPGSPASFTVTKAVVIHERYYAGSGRAVPVAREKVDITGVLEELGILDALDSFGLEKLHG